jgi:hypothetical protein
MQIKMQQRQGTSREEMEKGRIRERESIEQRNK